MPHSRTSAVPFCRRRAKLMSAGCAPMLPDPNPMKRSVPVSDAVNWTAIPCCWETALASGQPLQPLVFCRLLPEAETLINPIHRAASSDPDGAVGVGPGAGAGAGADVGVGVGLGAGAGRGAGIRKG